MSDQANQIHIRLVTPERILVDKFVDSVELPSKTGYLQVLYGHTPLLAELGAGEVTLRTAEGDERYNVCWGFAEVLPDRVTVLASDALKPEEIDVPRANQQLDRGMDLWKQAGEDAEAYDEALRVITEAESKLATASVAKH